MSVKYNRKYDELGNLREPKNHIDHELSACIDKLAKVQRRFNTIVKTDTVHDAHLKRNKVATRYSMLKTKRIKRMLLEVDERLRDLVNHKTINYDELIERSKSFKENAE